MAKAYKNKGRRKRAVRSAKRTKTNTWSYMIVALIVIAGVALIAFTNMTRKPDVGPFVADQSNPTNPHNKDSHWHAALGMWNCDAWMGDSTGQGIWNWPASTQSNSPARASNTNVYAGLHSHDDGIIHMEPATQEEAGRHATIGKYFEFGGWKLSSSSFDFLGTKVKNGDKCGTGTGTMQWAVAHFNGDTTKKQDFKVMTGNPADFKLHNDDVIIIAFLPPGKTIQSLGNPPSLKNLPDAASRTTQSPPSNQPTPPATSSTPNTAATGSPTPTVPNPTVPTPGGAPTSAP